MNQTKKGLRPWVLAIQDYIPEVGADGTVYDREFFFRWANQRLVARDAVVDENGEPLAEHFGILLNGRDNEISYHYGPRAEALHGLSQELVMLVPNEQMVESMIKNSTPEAIGEVDFFSADFDQVLSNKISTINWSTYTQTAVSRLDFSPMIRAYVNARDFSSDVAQYFEVNKSMIQSILSSLDFVPMMRAIIQNTDFTEQWQQFLSTQNIPSNSVTETTKEEEFELSQNDVPLI